MATLSTAQELLLPLIEPGKAMPWLTTKLLKLRTELRPRDFYLAFSAASRFVPQTVVKPVGSLLRDIEASYPNFSATEWTQDQLARIILMCALPEDRNQAILDDLFATADYRELVALYKGLYWLPNAADFVGRAREGSRTNMTGVFDALALDNPFPAAYLPEDAWNQLVLKGMFMSRPMYRFYRIEDRKNPTLAAIFLDYAEERWSAHRAVSPELWRFVDGYVADRFMPGLIKTATEGEPLERQAALRVLINSDFPAAQAWVRSQNVTTETFPDWDTIGRENEVWD
ncbi:MAG: EboA domain-containing protein [Bacteroidota bacterium]